MLDLGDSQCIPFSNTGTVLVILDCSALNEEINDVLLA